MNNDADLPKKLRRKKPKDMKPHNRRNTAKRPSKRVHVRLFRWFAAFVWVVSISIGIGIGWALTSVEGLAERVRELENLHPSQASVVYDMHGKVLHAFEVQKRIPVETFKEIPDLLKATIIATEDEHFFTHPGIDPLAILRALYRNFITRRWTGQGASTITQQVARMVFLSPEKTLQRKIKEAFLALQIEKQFTKEEIFLQYYNNVYLGHGVYGFEAASRYYFEKTASKLKPEEAAMLTGLIQRPEAYTPYRHPDRALKRRNYVLKRMLLEKVIDQRTYLIAASSTIRLATHEERPEFAPYFIEEVRKYIDSKYGSETLYHGGLKIYTTLDPLAQKYSEASLKTGLYEWAKRRRKLEPLYNVLEKYPGTEIGKIILPEWPKHIFPDDEVLALVTEVKPREVRWRIAQYQGSWSLDDDLSWLRLNTLEKNFKPGDVYLARFVSISAENHTMKAEPLPIPKAEGAMVALDPLTGEIRAMVGGYSFARNKYNRATQAKRQTGSAFKPVVWITALQRGYSMARLIQDAPIALEDPYLKTTWTPGNFDNRYLGLLTLQRALELSRNTVSVRLAMEVGLNHVIDMAHKLGLDVEIPPYPSIALGTIEVTPLQLTALYAVFANGGIRVQPYMVRRIEDRYGHILESNSPEYFEAIPANLAFIITNALEGVIRRGTAYAAHDLPFDAAGKTGTTDNFTDAWFIGYTPIIVAGVWIGYDEPSRLGYNETGGHTALPVWKQFMLRYMAGKPAVQFPPPDQVIIIPVDLETGLRATPECAKTVLMSFIPGTEPTEYCTAMKQSNVLATRPIDSLETHGLD